MVTCPYIKILDYNVVLQSLSVLMGLEDSFELL